MTDLRRMRTWAEIDLDALEHNYHTLRALAPQGCKFLGLVKADAYGHGAVSVARKLQSLGADMLAAPVVTKGTRERTVYFPAGLWEDKEGVRYQGRTAQVLASPIEKFLWFKRVKE